MSVLKKKWKPAVITAGNTRRIGRKITRQNRGFERRDTNEQVVVRGRPESNDKGSRDGNISDPNNHVTDEISVW